MYEGDEINSFDSNGTFDRPGAIMSSSPNEQQNAAPAKPQKSSWKGNEPDPMFFEEPMPESRQRRTRRKRPWFIGIGILILIVAAAITVVAIINSTKSVTAGDPAIAGQAYLVGLFDKNAPIPFRSTTVAQYGYISPSSFEWVTPREYSEANPFYGDYARVRSGGKDLIINRKGEIVVDTAGKTTIKYDVNDNVWTVGSDVYNGEMEKANPDNSKAEYIGHGYAFVTPNDTGDRVSTGSPYLVKVENGEKAYQCEQTVCSIATSYGKSGDGLYFIVQESGRGAKIIDAFDGTELFTSTSGYELAKIDDGLFVELEKKTNQTNLYVRVDHGGVFTSRSLPADNPKNSISRSGKYYKKSCGANKGLTIIDASENEVVPCGIEKLWGLSENTYKMLGIDNKEAVLILRGDGIHLFDMKSNKDIKVYKDAINVKIYDNSAFIRITLKTGQKQVCNVLEPSINCVDIATDITPYPTYFIAEGKVYTHDLKEVKYEE